MLRIRLSKQYGSFRLNVDIAFAPGSTCLFGPSGCGKTTLGRLTAGLAVPDEGEITWDDQVLFSSARGVDVHARLRRVAYVPQDVLLFPHLNVERNLRYGLDRLPAERRAIGFDDVVRVLDIGDLLDRRSDQLSGGQAQRVAIGRALLSSPRLVVMDEPLSSLDRDLKLRILPYLQEVHGRFGVQLLYITHDPGEIFAVAGDVVMLDRGSVIAQGPPSTIFDNAAAFSRIAEEGFVNLIEGRAVAVPETDHAVLDCGGFRLDPGPRDELRAGVRVAARVHARNIILATSAPTGLSAQNVVPGVVQKVIDAGREFLVHIDSGRDVVAEVTPKALRQLDLSPGRAVYWVVKSHSVHVDVLSPGEFGPPSPGSRKV